MTLTHRTTLLATAAATALALAACSPATDSTATDDTATIVASTAIWADVARAVAPDADVSAIVGDANVDPHSFEPSAADLAGAASADVVVANGGGYDSWLYSVVDQDKIVHALPLVDGHDHGAEEDEHADHGHSTEGALATVDGNEHIWYDTDAVRDVAHELAVEINAHSDVTVDDEDVIRQLDEIDERKEDIEEATTAQTHPLADDILTGTAITDATPEGYRQATLKESEPSAADVAAMLDLIESGDLDFLIDAPQTSDQVSTRLVEAATAKGLRIVNVLEAPNADETYFDLYNRILDDLEQA